MTTVGISQASLASSAVAMRSSRQAALLIALITSVITSAIPKAAAGQEAHLQGPELLNVCSLS
jgi:hypothetical protein